MERKIAVVDSTGEALGTIRGWSWTLRKHRMLLPKQFLFFTRGPCAQPQRHAKIKGDKVAIVAVRGGEKKGIISGPKPFAKASSIVKKK